MGNKSNLAASLAACCALMFVHSSSAANGTWNSTNAGANAYWTNAANWSASPAPVGNQTATFNNAGNGRTTINLEGLSIISNIVFDTSSAASYTLGSNGVNQQLLCLTNGSILQITSTAVSGQRVNAAVQLGQDRSASSHTFRNDQPYGTLVIAGDITATNSGSAGGKTLTVAGIGNVVLSGNVTPGGASSLTLTDSTLGQLLMTGSNRINTVNINSGTFVLAGTNLLDTVTLNNDSAVNLYGTNSLQMLTVNGTGRSIINVMSGWLSFTNGGGQTIVANQNVVINGPGYVVLPSGPSSNPTGDNYAGAGKTLTINAALTGSAGLELWSGSGTYVLNGTNDFGGNVTMGPAGTLSVFKIGNRGATDSNLGKGTNITFGANGARLLYTGAGETSDRILTLNANTIIEDAGTGYLKLTVPVTVASGGKTLTLQGSTSGVGEFAGQLRNDSGTLSLIKDGSGTWNLSSNNTYTGSTVLNNGTLALIGSNGTLSASASFTIGTNAVLLLANTPSANNTNRLYDTATFTLCGGTLNFSNGAGSVSYSENIGAVTLSQGNSAIAAARAAIGQTSTLRVASLAQASGATVNFVGEGLGDDSRNRIFITAQPDGPIGPWATVNGTNLAAYSSSRGVYAVAYDSLYADIAARGPSSTIVSNDASYVRINLPGDTGPIQLGSPVTRVTALIQNTATPATVATASKTFQASSVSVPNGQASVTLGENAGDGTIAPLVSNGELGLSSDGTGALTVNAAIANNGSASKLTKYGTGTATLAAANPFSGTVTVCDGSLILANANALQSGTLATGGAVFDSSVGSHAFTFGNVSGNGNIALADNAATPNAVSLTAGGNNASTTFGGSLTGAGGLTKAGTGTLTLSGTNSLTGGITVGAGAVTASALGALGLGPVVNNGTLNLTAGAVTYSGLSQSLSGAGTVNVTLGTWSSTTYLNGDYSGFTGTWIIGLAAGPGSSKAMMNGADNAAATVIVRTNATLMASTPVAHAAALTLQGGSLGETYGQLRIEGGAQWSGSVTLANNIVGVTNGFFGCTTGTGTISGVIADVGGAHAVAKLGNGTLALTGANTYAGDTSVRAGTLAVNSLKSVGQACALGMPTTAANGTIRLGTNTTGATFSYFGPGDTTDRILALNLTNGTVNLDMSGTGPLKFTSDLAIPLPGLRTLQLQGSTTGTAEFAGSLINGNASTTTLYKAGSGTWILSGANTYVGETYVTGGKLIAANPGAIGTNGTLHFTGSTGVLELDNDGGPSEADLKIDTGVGNIGTLAVGRATPGSAITHVLGSLTLSTVTLNVTNGANVTSGTPGVQFTQLNMGAGGGGATILIPCGANLCINGPVSIYSNGGNAKGPQLDGTSAGNAIMGPISNGLGTVFLTKTNSSVWTLYGSNTFTGATLIKNGVLALAGTNGALLGTSGITLAGNGTLLLSNSALTNCANRLGDSIALTLSGGTLSFTNDGGAANFSETAGALSIGAGTNRIVAAQAAEGQTASLTFASLAHSGGGQVDFCGDGLGVSDRNKILFSSSPGTGLIGLWATYNGTNFAAYDSTLGVVAAYDSAFTNLTAKGPEVIPSDAQMNAQIVDEGSSGPISLAAGTTCTMRSLLQNAQWASSVAMTNQTLLVNDLMIATNKEALTIGTAENEGLIMPQSAGGTLSLINQSAAALTLNASITNNSSASSVAKFGPGTVTVIGKAAYTGTTLINEGALEFGGSGTQKLNSAISGAGALVKSGSGTLQLFTGSTYTGPTYINAGIVRPNSGTAFGSTASGTFIASGATLDVGSTPDVGGTLAKEGLNLGSEPFTVSGAGYDGTGAIINNSTGSQMNAIGQLALADDATFGGSQRWDIRYNTLNLNSHIFCKTGIAELAIVSETVNPGAGHFTVNQGLLRFESSAAVNGGSTNTVTVNRGAILELYNLSPNAPALKMILNDGSFMRGSGTSTSTNLNVWAGPVVLNGLAFFNANAANINWTVTGDISGSGSIVKAGTSPATLYLLNTNNTYAGTTIVSNGTLYAKFPGSLPGYDADARVSVVGGAALVLWSGDGTNGWNASQISALHDKATFINNTAGLSIETTQSPITYLGNLSKTLALTKQGTNSLALLGTNTFTGALTVNGGTLTFGNAFASSVGAVTLNNAGTVLRFSSGSSNTMGAVTVNNGWLDLDGNSTNTVTGSVTAKANGLVTIEGPTSLGVNTFSLGTASGDRPMLIVSTNATFNKLIIGSSQNAAGSAILNGGVFTVGYTNISTDILSVGTGGGSGYFRMNAGTLYTGQFGISGGGNGANNGVVDLFDGSATCSATNGWLIWGWAGGNGVLNLFNASLTAPPGVNDTTLAYVASKGTFGMLNLLGPRAVLNATGYGTARGVNMARNGGNAASVVNLNGGTLVANQVRADVSSTPTFFNFGGGTLKANVSQTQFMQGLAYATVYPGGATIDTTNVNVTVSQPLQAPTGYGVGNITVAAGGQGYIGAPVVIISGGSGTGATAIATVDLDMNSSTFGTVTGVTVTSPGSGYLASDVLAVNFCGGGFTNSTPAVALAQLWPNSSAGGLTKLGSGVLTLGGTNTYGGTTTVAAGTLKLGNALALPANTPVSLAGGTLDLNGFTVTNTVRGTGSVTNGTLVTVLSPAGAGAIGTDTLALSSATVSGTYFADVTRAGSSDLVAVQGSLSLSGLTLSLVDTDQLDRDRAYTIMTYSGTCTGVFASTNLPDSHWHVIASGGNVRLVFSQGTVLELK